MYRRALIVGASGGIGGAIADAVARLRVSHHAPVGLASLLQLKGELHHVLHVHVVVHDPVVHVQEAIRVQLGCGLRPLRLFKKMPGYFT